METNIVPCPECGQKLRVPAQKTGLARCPNCDYRFEVNFPASASGFRTYDHAKMRFRLSIPSDFTVQDEVTAQEPPNIIVARLMGPLEGGIRPCVTMVTQLLKNENVSLQSYRDRAAGQLAEVFGGFHLLEEQDVTFLRHPAALMRYGYRTRDHDIEELHLAAFLGNGDHRLMFQFLCESAAATAERDHQVFRRIIASMQVERFSLGLRLPFVSLQDATQCNQCDRPFTDGEAVTARMSLSGRGILSLCTDCDALTSFQEPMCDVCTTSLDALTGSFVSAAAVQTSVRFWQHLLGRAEKSDGVDDGRVVSVMAEAASREVGVWSVCDDCVAMIAPDPPPVRDSHVPLFDTNPPSQQAVTMAAAYGWSLVHGEWPVSVQIGQQPITHDPEAGTRCDFCRRIICGEEAMAVISDEVRVDLANKGYRFVRNPPPSKRSEDGGNLWISCMICMDFASPAPSFSQDALDDAEDDPPVQGTGAAPFVADDAASEADQMLRHIRNIFRGDDAVVTRWLLRARARLPDAATEEHYRWIIEQYERENRGWR